MALNGEVQEKDIFVLAVLGDQELIPKHGIIMLKELNFLTFTLELKQHCFRKCHFPQHEQAQKQAKIYDLFNPSTLAFHNHYWTRMVLQDSTFIVVGHSNSIYRTAKKLLYQIQDTWSKTFISLLSLPCPVYDRIAPIFHHII